MEAAKPWTPPAANAPVATARKTDWGRALPFVGPVVLFIIWDLVVRLGFIKPILLPPRLQRTSPATPTNSCIHAPTTLHSVGNRSKAGCLTQLQNP